MESEDCQNRIRLTDDFQMKEIDRRTVEEIGLPAIVLIETAAHAVVRVVEELLEESGVGKNGRILAIYGTGGNGSDAIAASRLLHCKGYKVQMLSAFPTKKMTESASKELELAKKVNVSEITRNVSDSAENSTYISREDFEGFSHYDIILDGIFGVGLSRNLEGEIADFVEEINRSGARIVSMDIPSGVQAGTGKILGTAMKAEVTVTFGEEKIGQYVYPGKEYCGRVVLADIGFPPFLTTEVCGELQPVNEEKTNHNLKDMQRTSAWRFSRNAKHLLSRRAERSNKGTYGKVLIFAGSKDVTGAAILAAKAAYKTGVGLVEVVSVKECIDAIRIAIPEAMTFVISEAFDELEKERLRLEISHSKAILAGPGIGTGALAKKVLDCILAGAKEYEIPLVLDADAVNLLSEELPKTRETSVRLVALNQKLSKATILTPHPKEVSRLLEISVKEILEAPIDIAKQCIYNSELIYVLKDAATIVAGNGEIYVNTSGCNGMATGGSGDVLAGMITGLLTAENPFEAATKGVFLHGLTGEKASEKLGTRSMLAGDLIEAYPEVLLERG